MTSPVNPVPSSPAGIPAGGPAAGFPAPAAGMGMPAPEPKRSWFARHKILTGIGAFIAVGMIASALNGGGGSGNSSTTAATLPSIQSMASAPAQATAGQDSAAAPSPQQQEPAKDAEKSDSALSFPGNQRDDVVDELIELVFVRPSRWLGGVADRHADRWIAGTPGHRYGLRLTNTTGQRVLVVTHGGFGNSLLRELLGASRGWVADSPASSCRLCSASLSRQSPQASCGTKLAP